MFSKEEWAALGEAINAEEYRKADTILGNAFSWVDSAQGHAFWKAIATAIQKKSFAAPPNHETPTQNPYLRLHDFVSDMIEGGRLTFADIPDDYDAILLTLLDCNKY